MKEPLIGSDRCIFTFYDQPSSKQLPCWRLSETLNTGLFTHKYTHKHTRTHTQTDKEISGKQEKGIEPLFFCQCSTVIPRTKGHCQLHLFASHWFYNQVCWAMPGCFFQSCRHSSSSSSLQLKPCVVEKQASVCGEIACLEWEGACRLQRSQSEHANSSWPSHTPCCRMHLNSQSGIPTQTSLTPLLTFVWIK